MSGLDGFDGFDARGAKYGPEHGENREQEADGGYPQKDPRLKGSNEDGQREEGLEHAGHEPANQQPNADAEHHAENGYLDPDEHGTHGYRRWVHSERHGCADLASLRLHHAGREVQCRERRAGEQDQRQYVVHLLVALRVLGESEV